jgi:hypothetical protein
MRHNNITMENIFKLTYPNKEAAVADLKAKNILIEVDGIDGEKHEAYGNGVASSCRNWFDYGNLTRNGWNGYCNTTRLRRRLPLRRNEFRKLYDFGANLVEPKNPKHAFSGHAITEEYVPQFLGDEA